MVSDLKDEHIYFTTVYTGLELNSFVILISSGSLRYTDRNTIWVSMGGYDAGCIYELQPDVKEPVRSTIIKDGDDCEIHSCLEVEDKFEALEEKGEEVLELPEETFFFGGDLNTIVPRFSRKMVHLLLRYHSCQFYEIQRLHNWEKMEKRKPYSNKNHPHDDRKMEEARRTLKTRNNKLKKGAQCEPQSFKTLAYQYHEVLMLREQPHAIPSSFNKTVFELQNVKKTINDFIEEKRWRLKTIHENIP
uniref:Uncharacterized protein n=1 Tax=Glossina palpalis gambiensis TaxID=67801 RepID=A0A1B0AS24_9MUSC